MVNSKAEGPAGPRGGLAAALPDIAFAFDADEGLWNDRAEPPVDEPVDTAARSAELIQRIVREFTAVAPPGWQQLDALFTLSVGGGIVVAYFTDVQGNAVAVEPSAEAVELAHQQRRLSAQSADGPWWRMLVRARPSDTWQVEYDHGEEPFPEDQLFEPEAYRADLLAFPRQRLPVWLAAYIGHGGAQRRDPGRAAQGDARKALPASGLPDLPGLWARWALIAAAHVATGSEWGPRILPALGWFEGNSGGGSTLVLLPGGRAVLSGGTWDAPALEAAYNGGAQLPDLYAGAPDWLADPVLNQRAAKGLLSFCYWWDGAGWWHGASPDIAEIAPAVPEVWTSASVVDVVTAVLSERSTTACGRDIAELLVAAEAGTATRTAFAELLGNDPHGALDDGYYQLLLAGVGK